MNTPPVPRRRLLRGALATAVTAPFLPRGVAALDQPWTVGVIGDTDRGGYGHGLDTVWLGLPETKIAGVSDPSSEGRAKAVDRLKLAPGAAFADYREMLAKTKPGLVAVCPRHIDQHRDMILAAIEAGASGYLLKAAPAEELIAGVRSVAAGEVALSPAIAVQLVSRMRAPAPTALTARELEVLRLVAEGLSNRVIGERLFVGEATVKTHLLRVFEKLGVNDRTRAVTLAMERGLL